MRIQNWPWPLYTLTHHPTSCRTSNHLIKTKGRNVYNLMKHTVCKSLHQFLIAAGARSCHHVQIAVATPYTLLHAFQDVFHSQSEFGNETNEIRYSPGDGTCNTISGRSCFASRLCSVVNFRACSLVKLSQLLLHQELKDRVWLAHLVERRNRIGVCVGSNVMRLRT